MILNIILCDQKTTNSVALGKKFTSTGEALRFLNFFYHNSIQTGPPLHSYVTTCMNLPKDALMIFEKILCLETIVYHYVDKHLEIIGTIFMIIISNTYFLIV